MTDHARETAALPRDRRIRSVLIAILIVLVPIGLHQLWDYIEVRRLVAEIKAVIDRGEPVSEAQVFPGPWPKDKDAAEYYLAAGLIALDTRPAGVDPVRLWLAGGSSEPSADIAEALREYVDQSADALALADKGAALNFSRLPPGTEYSYRTSHLLAVSRLLTARTLSLSWAGDGDAAVASALSALKVRRAIREVGWEFLYAASHEAPAILSLSRPSPGALLELQKALETADERDEVLDMLLARRARAIEGVWRRHYGQDPFAPDDYLLPMRSVMELVRRPAATHSAVRVMRRWRELIEAARRPWPERLRAMDAATPHRRPRALFSAENMFRLPDAPYEPITSRLIVFDRASMVAIAIERFRRDHGGALPGVLTDIVPQYLTALPVDPYSGAPMLFTRDALSYTVYSIGVDRADDGGDLISELHAAKERGYGPQLLRGRDAGVRVLLQ